MSSGPALQAPAKVARQRGGSASAERVGELEHGVLRGRIDRRGRPALQQLAHEADDSDHVVVSEMAGIRPGNPAAADPIQERRLNIESAQ